MLRTLLFSIVFSSSYATAHISDEPDPTPMVVIGNSSPILENKLQLLRKALEDARIKWTALGMNPPPPVTIYVFGDTEGMRVREVLEKMNPGVDLDQKVEEIDAELKKHPVVKWQDAFYGLLDPSSLERARSAYDCFFDDACFANFAFSVHGTRDALINNSLFDESLPARTEAQIQMMDSPRNHYVLHNLRDHAAIVVPRRYSETKFDLDSLSTVNDLPMMIHEYAHSWVEAGIPKYQSMNLAMKELLCDHLTAMVVESTEVAPFYLAASAKIYSRLGEKEFLSLPEVTSRVHFEQKRHGIRKQNSQDTLATTPRHVTEVTPHDVGDIARQFMWSLRRDLTPQDQRRFDQMTINVFKALAQVPPTDAPREAFANYRITWLRNYQLLIGSHEAKLLLKSVLKKRNLLAEAEAIIRRDPQLVERLNQAHFSKRAWKQNIVNLAVRIPLEDGRTLQEAALIKTQARLMQWESNSNRFASWLNRLGLKTDRPIVIADIITPELIREFYNQAQIEMPELLPQIITQAERATAENVLIVPTGTPQSMLVFLRQPLKFTGPALKARLEKLARQLIELKNSVVAARPYDRPSETDAYLKKLSVLQKFERTGNPVALFVRYPGLTATGVSTGLLAGAACARWLSGI